MLHPEDHWAITPEKRRQERAEAVRERKARLAGIEHHEANVRRRAELDMFRKASSDWEARMRRGEEETDGNEDQAGGQKPGPR
ncbi:hypothetical protein LCGC14_1018320 [marine sediment metagenome]|uniref:Uncharacterized protein n=1 Tax=marine sediment metagenome TaxID=412755 RepID=A0A0F9N2P4_9ZZZZ